jgi:hypothetical protein
MLAMRSSIVLAIVSWGSILLFSPTAAADEESATVNGTVTLKGKPLERGKIIFYLDGDQFVGAKIKDGYTVGKVPPGTRRVTVDGEGVPVKYGTDDTTPLLAEIKKGGNTIHIVLE